MISTSTREPALSDDDLGRVLELMRGADSVELELTIPDGVVDRPSLRLRSIRSMLRSARRSSSTRQTLRSTKPAWWCAPVACRDGAAIQS